MYDEIIDKHRFIPDYFHNNIFSFGWWHYSLCAPVHHINDFKEMYSRFYAAIKFICENQIGRDERLLILNYLYLVISKKFEEQRYYKCDLTWEDQAWIDVRYDQDSVTLIFKGGFSVVLERREPFESVARLFESKDNKIKLLTEQLEEEQQHVSDLVQERDHIKGLLDQANETVTQQEATISQQEAAMSQQEAKISQQEATISNLQRIIDELSSQNQSGSGSVPGGTAGFFRRT